MSPVASAASTAPGDIEIRLALESNTNSSSRISSGERPANELELRSRVGLGVEGPVVEAEGEDASEPSVGPVVVLEPPLSTDDEAHATANAIGTISRAAITGRDLFICGIRMTTHTAI